MKKRMLIMLIALSGFHSGSGQALAGHSPQQNLKDTSYLRPPYWKPVQLHHNESVSPALMESAFWPPLLESLYGSLSDYALNHGKRKEQEPGTGKEKPGKDK